MLLNLIRGTIFIACVLASFILHGQANVLKAGDRIPDIILQNVSNYSSDELKLTDLKGKLVLIDFWGTGCKACINAFPNMEKLQREFNDKIQIILVNKENKDSTDRFFQKHKSINKPALPFISGNNILFSLFPHNYNPWHIWIDRDGVVRYIADGYNATSENISAFLREEKLGITQLEFKPEMEEGEYDKPMLIKENLFNSIQYYSYISRSISGFSIGERNGSPTDNNGIRFSSSSTITGLFKKAFSEKGKYNFDAQNCLLLDVPDSTKYYPPADKNKLDLWKAENGYYYDLVVPKSKEGKLYEIMKQDLMRFFDIDAHIEKRKINCLVLVRTSDIDKISFNESLINQKEANSDSAFLHYYNRPIKDVVESLNHFFVRRGSKMPVIDGTGYHGEINIKISRKMISEFGLGRVNEELKKYDLGIIEMECIYDVLILKEKTNL